LREAARNLQIGGARKSANSFLNGPWRTPQTAEFAFGAYMYIRERASLSAANQKSAAAVKAEAARSFDLGQ